MYKHRYLNQKFSLVKQGGGSDILTDPISQQFLVTGTMQIRSTPCRQHSQIKDQNPDLVSPLERVSIDRNRFQSRLEQKAMLLPPQIVKRKKTSSKNLLDNPLPPLHKEVRSATKRRDSLKGQDHALLTFDTQAEALDKVTPTEIRLQKILIDMAAPHVSAQSWAIFDTNSMNFIFGKYERERREVASLTKIMTCCTVLKLAQRFEIDINNEVLTVSERASKVAGTSADLVKGDKFTVWHLLHGLMLPSGNDAACAIAEHFGKLLIANKSQKYELTSNPQQNGRRNIYATKNSQFLDQPEVLAFIEEMNKQATEMGLKSSFFDTPHGLPNWYSLSTAYDVCRLCCLAMKDPLFRQIVGTKVFKVLKSGSHNSKTYIWENTHRMLWHKGVTGIKTGVTQSAGPCLATCMTKEGYSFIVVLLCCKSVEARFIETNKLARWVVGRLNKIQQFKRTLPPNNNEQIFHSRILQRIKHL